MARADVVRPKNPMLCQWCGQLATGVVAASGMKPWVTVAYCDSQQCQDRTFEHVQHYPVRKAKMIEQPPVLF